ncbi:PGC-1 and ERR-induced regulator in muscle protein 1 isoform X1 [Pseudonaja textilis]|uniref:PGC-1 and ERR-induced regulator in muscle protein 1 isoform X1 n=2 Tax=Pseudonaja textilis TaxID=8673 RepID=UPI000EA99D32|nr:PGC-1 and ERR-induced regulator in muscle protein 1 isoform X1 [Pseudonaja textilis]
MLQSGKAAPSKNVMENFEYSIQLNDRDWAEFYFVSEECRLIPPALATAEDQLLGDLEEGEAEGKKGSAAHPKASRLPCDVPGGHLLAEDAFSGSEDESDLGSVSRFLCRSQQAFRPSQAFPSPLSSLPLNPHLPRPATSSVPLSVAKEDSAGTVGWLMDPKTKTEAHITQEKDSQEPHPRPETGEKPLVVLPLTSTTESPEGANGLEAKYPQDHTSLTASPGSTSHTAVSEKLGFPKLRDVALDPSSLGVSSVLSPTSGEAEDPEKEVKCLQVALRASFQETHSPSSQEHSVQLRPLLVSSRSRTSGKKEEDVPETEKAAEDHSRNLSPNTSQEGNQAKDNGVEGCPEALEEDGSPDASLEVDHRGPAASSGKMERQNNGEPCLPLDLAIPPEGESPTRTPENPRLVPYQLKSHGCPEEVSTNVTWPEVYDYFFLDDLHEVERPPLQEGTSWKTSHGRPSELPAMSGPEMYEYFFQDVGEPMIEEETRSKSETTFSSAHGLVPSTDLEEPPSNTSTDPMGFPEVYEHFFVHQPQAKSHHRPNLLAVPASELKKAVRTLTSLASRPVRFLRSRPKRRGSQPRVMLISPTLLDRTSPRPENLGVAVFKPERPLQLVLTPRDLCLGFVALASWAVKTSNLHSPDAWKIVLLANFGTLSAIRCFRRQVVMESHHGS